MSRLSQSPDRRRTAAVRWSVSRRVWMGIEQRSGCLPWTSYKNSSAFDATTVVGHSSWMFLSSKPTNDSRTLKMASSGVLSRGRPGGLTKTLPAHRLAGVRKREAPYTSPRAPRRPAQTWCSLFVAPCALRGYACGFFFPADSLDDHFECPVAAMASVHA
jgi:hypothetical protein